MLPERHDNIITDGTMTVKMEALSLNATTGIEYYIRETKSE